METVRTRIRILGAMAAVAVVALLAGCAGEPAPDLTEVEVPEAAPVVTTLGILGDSISLGVNACQSQGQCAKASWSGGSDPAVGSVAARLAAASGTVPKVVNAAKDGGSVGDALGLVDEVLAAHPQLVTVLLGGNDACAPSLEEMTPTADFEAELTELFGRVSTEAPDAAILALSVPDIHHLWEVGRTNDRAVEAWNGSASCRNLLGAADDDSAAATARRDAVAARVDEFNSVIARVCAATDGCIDDAGALHAYPFTTDQLSSIDFFHPSTAGQRAIAEIAWDALERGAG